MLVCHYHRGHVPRMAQCAGFVDHWFLEIMTLIDDPRTEKFSLSTPVPCLVLYKLQCTVKIGYNDGQDFGRSLSL